MKQWFLILNRMHDFCPSVHLDDCGGALIFFSTLTIELFVDHQNLTTFKLLDLIDYNIINSLPDGILQYHHNNFWY